ncbi:ABC transporter substrate-binding protein [Mycoplasmatota bacterium WC44]
MKKLVSLTLILITLLGCSKESEKITVVLDWTPNTNHTGLYVALENGYFEEYNLDVEIIQPDGYSEQIVASNTAQFGISAQEYVISARSNDIPVVSLAAIIHDNTSGFISRETSNITRPSDFENKTYCGWGSATESAIIKELVESDGGDFSKVNVTTNYLDIFTDVNNECDFFWVFEAWQVEQAKLENIEYNYLSMIDYSNELNFHTPVIITNEKMIEENSDTVKDFMSAVRKGYEYAITNPSESADILLKHAPELNSELVKSSQLFLTNHYKKDGIAWGVQSDEYWTNFNTWLVDREIVPSINISDAYTNEYLEDGNN